MSARNKVFIILGVLAAASLLWYFLTVDHTSDLKLIGTVDANEVHVSARISGRIDHLFVEEGQTVKAGQLIATIESADLAAADRAALGTRTSQQQKLAETVVTERQTAGETSSGLQSAEAALLVARANQTQAAAQLEHQKADTQRTVELANQGVMSAQAKDEAVTSQNASQAALDAALHNVTAAEAAVRQARAHELQAAAAKKTVASTLGLVENADAMADQARVELGYARVLAPVDGKVNVKAAREGEVVQIGAPIVTVMQLSETWVYAPLPETQADAVKLGDDLKVVMPSGATIIGHVISKSSLADFATQRDINGSRKRDIRTVQIKLLIPNDAEQFVPGMTAWVFVPKAKLKPVSK
jgi:multidrug resistance efflux pump